MNRKERAAQGLLYVPFILLLPKFFATADIYLSQIAADVLTTLVCVCSIPRMKALASAGMAATANPSDQER